MQIDRETIIKLEREAFDRPINTPSEADDAMEHFAKLVAEHEREACAKVVNDDRGLSDDDAIRLMRAIRARGK